MISNSPPKPFFALTYLSVLHTCRSVSHRLGRCPAWPWHSSHDGIDVALFPLTPVETDSVRGHISFSEAPLLRLALLFMISPLCRCQASDSIEGPSVWICSTSLWWGPGYARSPDHRNKSSAEAASFPLRPFRIRTCVVFSFLSFGDKSALSLVGPSVLWTGQHMHSSRTVTSKGHSILPRKGSFYMLLWSICPGYKAQLSALVGWCLEF